MPAVAASQPQFRRRRVPAERGDGAAGARVAGGRRAGAPGAGPSQRGPPPPRGRRLPGGRRDPWRHGARPVQPPRVLPRHPRQVEPPPPEQRLRCAPRPAAVVLIRCWVLVCSGWKWLSLFRFKIWWMIPTVGEDAAGVPAETQMLLLESRSEAGAALYALMLPVLDGGFRASLQGSPENELQFCFESGRFILDLLDSEVFELKRTANFGISVGISEEYSGGLFLGDPEVQTLEAVDAVFINSGDNPFKLMKESIK